MFRTVIGPDGRLHQESEYGNMRVDLTTGETSFLGPRLGNMRQVFGSGGVTTEVQYGNVRQTIGGTGRQGPSHIIGGF